MSSSTRPIPIAAAGAPRGNQRSRLARELLDSLEEAGLGGQVRLGVPCPVDDIPEVRVSTPTPRADAPHPGTEEGVSPLDALLRPSARPARGRLIEISGEPSSGRTALAYHLVASATARGELAGWVDLPDALDPRFLRRSGASLRSLLWVRPPHARAALRAAELLLKTGFGLVVLDLLGAEPGALERLGAAAWSRLQRGARGARATAVLLGSGRAAGPFASLAIYTDRCQALFDRGLFEGLDARGSAVRNRAGPAAGTAHPFRVLHRPVHPIE